MSSSVQFIGIDFGTFSSKMAWYNPRTSQAESIRNSIGAEQTPSVVYLGEEILVGKDAVDRLDDREDRRYVITSVKRELEDTNESIELPGRSWLKYEVVAKILEKLKHDAEQLQFYQEVTHAVITCPASFSSVEKKILKQAAEQAGFVEVELLDEPVAAALAYTHMQQSQVGDYLLVYDLGAGTFDLAVLRREKDSMFRPAMSPMGIKRCGGDDFDEALYKYFDRIAVEQLGRHISLTGRRDLRFLQLCRQRKEDISTSNRRYLIEYILEPDSIPFKASIDRPTFEDLIEDKVMETVQLTQECLRRAREQGFNVDTLLLVGGSTRIPLVQKLLHESFSDPQPIFWQHSSLAVALGAAYYAYSLWRPENQYRNALKAAYSNRRLEEDQVVQLADLVHQIGLSQAAQIDIEYEVLGSTKEEILEQQRRQDQYRLVVEAAWANRYLSSSQIAALEEQAKALGLDARACAAIEYSVLGTTKEDVLKRQKAPARYFAALLATWVDGTFDQKELAYLFNLREDLKLSEQQYAAIERSVMSETLDVIERRSHVMEQYRRGVREFWSKKEFSRKKLFELYQLANNLELDDSQIDAIEYEVMRNTKEVIFNREYRPIWSRATPPTHLSPTYPTTQVVHEQREIFHFIGNIRVGDSEIVALTFSRDGRLLTCCNEAAQVYAWQLSQDDDDTLIQQDWKSVLSLIIACDRPKSLQYAEAHMVEAIKNWYARTQGGPFTLNMHQGRAHVMAFSPDGKTLAIASADGTIRLWDWYQARELAALRHRGGVRVLAFSLDGELLASGGEDTTIKLWDWRANKERPGSPLRSHSRSITSLAFSPNAQILVSGSNNGGIRLWKLPPMEPPFKPPQKHSDSISAIVFHPNGQLFATSGLDHQIHLWDLSGNHIHELTGHTDGVNTIAFSLDGLLASGSIRNELIRLWQPETEKFLQSITGNAGKISVIAFSPDGEILITSGASRTINVYERLHT